jgi:hypothetical protein
MDGLIGIPAESWLVLAGSFDLYPLSISHL